MANKAQAKEKMQKRVDDAAECLTGILLNFCTLQFKYNGRSGELINAILLGAINSIFHILDTIDESLEVKINALNTIEKEFQHYLTKSKTMLEKAEDMRIQQKLNEQTSGTIH